MKHSNEVKFKEVFDAYKAGNSCSDNDPLCCAIQSAWDQTQTSLLHGGNRHLSYRSTVQKDTELLLIDIVNCLNKKPKDIADQKSMNSWSEQLKALANKIPDDTHYLPQGVVQLAKYVMVVAVVATAIAGLVALAPHTGLFSLAAIPFVILAGASMLSVLKGRKELADDQTTASDVMKKALTTFFSSSSSKTKTSKIFADTGTQDPNGEGTKAIPLGQLGPLI